MFQKLLSKLSSLLKNGGPNWSSVRFAFLLSVFLSNIAFWCVWVFLCIDHGYLQKIPESVIVIYCLANGISYSGKLLQKPMEKKE